MGMQGRAKLQTCAADVVDLVEEAATKLKLDVARDNITLRLFGTDDQGNDKSIELDSEDTVSAALVKATEGGLRLNMAKLRIAVQVAPKDEISECNHQGAHRRSTYLHATA